MIHNFLDILNTSNSITIRSTPTILTITHQPLIKVHMMMKVVSTEQITMPAINNTKGIVKGDMLSSPTTQIKSYKSNKLQESMTFSIGITEMPDKEPCLDNVNQHLEFTALSI
jgi:hypothetical protein